MLVPIIFYVWVLCGVSLHRNILVSLIAAGLALIFTVVLGAALHPLDRHTLAILTQPVGRRASNVTRWPNSETLLVPIIFYVWVFCRVSLHRNIFFFLIAAGLAGVLSVVLGVALHPLDRHTFAILVKPKCHNAHCVARSRI